MVIKRQVEEIIEKGGKVVQENVSEKKFKDIYVRVPQEIVDEIDTINKMSGMQQNRCKWILTAIQERLKKIKNQ